MLDREQAVGGAALLAFRDPPDTFFSEAGKGDARRLRDEALPDASEFDAHPHLCIELGWRTQQGGVRRTRRQVRRDGAWVDLCFMPDRED